jgi:hypothetical protein
MDAFQRCAGVEHAAAAGAEYIPRQFENAESCRVQKGADHPLLIEIISRGESERVYATQRAIRRLGHETFDRGDGFAVGRLAQHREQSLGFVRQGRGHEAGSGQ